MVAGAIGRLGGSTVDPKAALARGEVHPTTVQLVPRRAALFKRLGDPEAELQILRARLADGERLTGDLADPSCIRLVIPARLKLHGGKCVILDGHGRPADTKSRRDPALIKGLKSARAHIAAYAGQPGGCLDDLALNVSPPGPYERNLSRLAFLAPDLQQMILEGRQPLGLSLTRILTGDLPARLGRPETTVRRRRLGVTGSSAVVRDGEVRR